mmetsp:Transcript_2633/g.7840  ORF Transcript_2633/g.7840 Transcript_2633/m.7840 type:complete len:123 (+) Transcript_2633:338-706(+)
MQPQQSLSSAVQVRQKRLLPLTVASSCQIIGELAKSGFRVSNDRVYQATKVRQLRCATEWLQQSRMSALLHGCARLLRGPISVSTHVEVPAAMRRTQLPLHTSAACANSGTISHAGKLTSAG